MSVFYFQNEAYHFPDNYREWDIQVDRDVARMAFRITSRATDTTGQQHGCESTVDDLHLRYSANEAQEYFRHVMRSHLRRIDDYSQDLALQGINLRPRYASGGSVRNPSQRLVGEQGAPYIGIDRASGPDVTAVAIARASRSAEQLGQSMSAISQAIASADFSAIEQRLMAIYGNNTPESLFPSEYEKPTEPEQQEEKPKRKRLQQKPPSEAPAQLAVKPKPRKLRL